MFEEKNECWSDRGFSYRQNDTDSAGMFKITVEDSLEFETNTLNALTLWL